MAGADGANGVGSPSGVHLRLTMPRQECPPSSAHRPVAPLFAGMCLWARRHPWTPSSSSCRLWCAGSSEPVRRLRTARRRMRGFLVNRRAAGRKLRASEGGGNNKTGSFRRRGRNPSGAGAGITVRVRGFFRASSARPGCR
eukprot:scaffold6440_cov101-Isochrysis_galbana.AAC.1